MVALPPTTVPFCGLADARPTIRADADTPASRPVTSGRRRDRSTGRTSIFKSSDGAAPGREGWDLRSRAARRAEVICARSELALGHLVDIRVLRIEDVGQLQTDRRRLLRIVRG